MKTRSVLVIGVLCVGLLAIKAPAAAADETGQGCIGIILNSGPLSPLLTKHLRLQPDEGLHIVNVQVDSPADKAGLERDDIIIALGDEPVTDHQAFVDGVREAGAGSDIALTIIHLGERKTVKLTLMSMEEMAGRTDWKYPPEPEPVETWQPGRMWFMQPGEEDWSEVPWHELFRAPGHQDVTGLFKELYTFRQRQNGKSYHITIEGDPTDKEAWITVRSGDTEHKVMAKDVDELPEEYRQAVRDALRRAREQKARRPRTFQLPTLPKLPNLNRDDVFKDLRKIRPQAPDKQNDETLDKIQEQMRQLQKEMEKLQKHQEEMAEQLRDAGKPADSGV